MKVGIISVSFLAVAHGASLWRNCSCFLFFHGNDAWLIEAVDNYGLPSYGLKRNGVAVGWLPSNGNVTQGVQSPLYTMKEINQRLGAVSSTYGIYSHITGPNYDGYELLEEYEDVITSGAVFIPAVMPVLSTGFSGITPAVATQIAAVMRKFTDRGVVIWLRYAFEMNWYVNPVSEKSPF